MVQEMFHRLANVLINVVGYLKDDQWIGETCANEWWKTFVRFGRLYSWDVEDLPDCRKSTSRALIL